MSTKRKVKEEVVDSVSDEFAPKRRRSERRNDAIDAIAKWAEIITLFKDKNGRTLFDILSRKGTSSISLEALKEFQARLGSKEISDPLEFWKCFDIFQDAVMNEYQDSPEYETVVSLRRNLAEGKEENGSGGDKTVQLRAPCQELIDYIYELRDAEGRLVHEAFQEKPLEELYPDYYHVINEPIDLRTIQKRVKSNSYASIDDLEKDVLLLVKNAHAYNKPGSQIFKDATAIRKGFSSFRVHVEKEITGVKTSRRIKSKKTFHYLTPSQSVDSDDDSNTNDDDSQATAEQGKDSGIPSEPGNLLVMLYNSVVKFINEDGRCLSEPFLRLPSRRTYPDYYQVIKTPMALLRIKAKLLRGNQYHQLDVLAKDIDLVFSNAQLYNEDDSQLYQDAVYLQSLLRTKLAELKKIEAIAIDEKPKLKSKNDDLVTGKKRKIHEIDQKGLKKKLMQLLSSISSYKDSDGRSLVEMFLELPSSKEYPEYYSVITVPIDLKTIENNIKHGKYLTEDSCVKDFELLFANAKEFNEEGSQIFEDANKLEKVLKKKRRALNQSSTTGDKPAATDGAPKAVTPTKSSRVIATPSSARRVMSGPSSSPANHCQTLLNHIKTYKDSTKRHLCAIFDHLPPKSEYPDYYLLIKKPIDLTRITAKVESNGYHNIDDFEQDLLLMFDNACRYNEPDSQVYKDALTLQREMLTKKAQLIGENGSVAPDVQKLLQSMLREFYDSLMQHRSESGRCLSDSLTHIKAEMPPMEDESIPKLPLSLQVIGQLINRGYYHRIDHFQDDVFKVLKVARDSSAPDLEMYESAVDLQYHFIADRDRLCLNGERVTTQSLSYTKRQFTIELEEEKSNRAIDEPRDTDSNHASEVTDNQAQTNDTREIMIKDPEQLISIDECVHNNETYRVGDFVYIEPREPNLKPHIVFIDQIWKQTDPAVVPQNGFHCCWFYRPEETYHPASRKFLEQELFKSDHYNHLNFAKITGRCQVVSVKDYLKFKAEGFEEKDYYTCESRYNRRSKQFSKIKHWTWSTPHVKLVSRNEPLTPKRIASVFAKVDDTTDKKSNDAIAAMDFETIDEMRRIIQDMEDENVESEGISQQQHGLTHYEQLKIQSGTYKIGDSVYVRSDEEYPYMARIDRIWVDSKDGIARFHGNWFLRPEEAKHMPTRMFYEQEVFQSNIDDDNPMASIMGKCCILHIKDYSICRPTEIPERDIYVCESRYDEGDGHIRKLKGLKRPLLSASVRDDEFYYFENSLTLKKRPSPWLIGKAPVEAPKKYEEMEVESPEEYKKNNAGERKIREQAGFALFTSEVGAAMRRRRATATDQEIERIANNEWRTLNGAKRAEYEARGRAMDLESSQPDDGSLLVYECGWGDCDHQYEDIQDLMVHVMESGGHLAKGENNEFPCSWQECVRVKKGLPPFPTYSKLARHIREVHFKVAAKRIQSFEKNRNYFPRHQAAEHSTSSRDSQYNDHIGPRGGLPGAPPPLYSTPQNPGTPVPMSVMPMSNAMQAHPMMQYRMAVSQPQIPGTPQQQGSPIPQQPGVILQRPPVMADGSVPGGPQMTGVVLQQSLTVEQQQLLIQQVQRQQQQIQKLQQQLATLTASSSSSSPSTATTNQEQQDPVFVAPPPNTQKIRHSEAYLRYIEGLRDNKQHMSQWNEISTHSSHPNLPPGTHIAPVMWLGGRTFGYNSSPEALHALRDHMLRDSVSVPKTS